MNTSVGSGFSVPYAESVLVTFVGGRELLFMKIIKEKQQSGIKAGCYGQDHFKLCTDVAYVKEGNTFVLLQ